MRSADETTRRRLRATLEAAGVVFIAENGGGAGARLKFSRAEVWEVNRWEDEGGVTGEDDITPLLPSSQRTPALRRISGTPASQPMAMMCTPWQMPCISRTTRAASSTPRSRATPALAASSIASIMS